MKNKLGLFLACVLAVTLTACVSLATIARWAPVGEAAFNSIVSIVAPSQSAKLQADVAVVDKTFVDLAADATAAQASGQTATVSGDLAAILADAPGIVADISPLVPANELAYVNDGLAVLDVTLAAYEAAVGSPAAPVAENFGCSGYQEYGDGTFHIWSDCANGIDAVDAVTGGAAAKANPKAKAPSVGSFKRQFNAVARKYNHADKQLKLSLAEHLHVR